jgi:hypothetical protein
VSGDEQGHTDEARLKVYIDTNDWWVGYYRGDTHHYICPLPTVVVRWNRSRVPAPVIVPGKTPFAMCTCATCGPPWRDTDPDWRERPFGGAWMTLCPTCGDKRCPGASRHDRHPAGVSR